MVPFRDLYPFRSQYLTLSGWKYHYVDEGSGDPLVMLHGNPTWSFYYRALIAAFSPTHRVIAPDHVGCGLSDKPQAYSYTLAQHINNLEALLDALELERLTLFLHDWGGPIGMGYALRHPERVKRFVVFNTAAFPVSRIPLRINVCKLPGFGALAVRGQGPRDSPRRTPLLRSDPRGVRGGRSGGKRSQRPHQRGDARKSLPRHRRHRRA